MNSARVRSDPRSPRGARVLGLALAAALSLIALARVWGVEPLASADRALYDFATLRVLRPPAGSERVALVLVDDASLEALGERWPLNRGTWARFIARLVEHGPAAVAVDAVFDEPGAQETLELAETVGAVLARPELDTSAPIRELRADLGFRLRALDGDRQLVEAVSAAGVVVLGQYFVLDRGPEGADDADPVALASQPLAEVAPDGVRLRAAARVANIEPLQVAARATGAINIVHDPDGVVRRYPYAVAWGDAAVPSLALATVRAATDDPARRERLTREATATDRATPLIRFPAEGSIPVFRFADLLLDDGRSPAADQGLRGRLVFVGVSPTGLHDSHVRAGGSQVAGALLQAVAADNLLGGALLGSEGLAAWAGFAETALLLLLALGVFWIVPNQATVFLALALALLLHAIMAFALGPRLGLWPGAAAGFAGLPAIAAAEMAGRYVAVQRHRRALLVRQQIAEGVMRSRQHLELIVDSVADAILGVDPAGVVVSANDAAAALFGLARGASSHGPVAALLPGWPGHEGEIARTAAPWECEGVRADGGTFVAEVVTSRIPPQDAAAPLGAAFVSVVRDITARREAESAKERFVAMVSHELRTPVTSIRGALGLVASGRLGEVPPDAARMVEVAHAGSQRLVRLVNDILDVARLDAGALELSPQPLELGAVVADAVAEAQGYAAEHRVALALSPASAPLPVHADRDRLGQVVANLVSNALKFSPEGDRVEVRLEALADRARVSVSDRGPGIPVEARPRIFERFAQAHTTTRRTRGSGLGLGIARSIVELHGGSIGFDTAVGEGTTFWFELPTASAPTEEAPA
ncbi:MAG: CHASE2 domain-containing protein [Deltaproteobacteria bacterium]|nr:CHASE2 domain-containing protein [Deltaproteobacteria bacterium]MCB9787549.1 CHASE2 domain-containing protein [Deltaproteobacteria bacterium]